MQGFVFNIRRPTLNDRRIREALGLLFDYEWTNRQLFNGAYTRTRSYFENSELAASGLPSEGELKILEPLRGKVPDEVFDKAFELPKTQGNGVIREQQRRGLPAVDRGRLESRERPDAGRSGQAGETGAPAASGRFRTRAAALQAQLADLGIELEIRRVDVSQYINRLRSRDYDMIVGTFSQSNSLATNSVSIGTRRARTIPAAATSSA